MVELRRVGNTDVSVHPVGLGCMGMSECYGCRNDEESLAVLKRSIELGATFWDTADVYGFGHNEQLLGKVLKENRDKVFLCTKVGCIRDESTGQYVGVSGKPEYVRSACEKSLERLGVETIDLCYLHRIDASTPIEETIKEMAELVKEGKVRYLGLSECSAEDLRRAHKVHPISAIQMEYSPWTRTIETNGVLAAARELGVSVVCYSPLGSAMFTNSGIKPFEQLEANDVRHFLPRFKAENFQQNKPLVDKIKVLASKKGVSLSQFVLAWILAQGPEFIVIPGTKRLTYLEQNIDAGEVALTPSEIADMTALLDNSNFLGGKV